MLVVSEIIKDPITKSEATVVSYLGEDLSRHGKLCDVVEVKIFNPKEHHKMGDVVVWFVPIEGEDTQC